MKASEIKKLIGKVIKYKSNRTHNAVSCGEVKEVVRGETYINGDWHDNKSIILINIL